MILWSTGSAKPGFFRRYSRRLQIRGAKVQKKSDSSEGSNLQVPDFNLQVA